jgi:hypothetical protein
MTSPERSRSRPHYSPDRRTALVLSGTGTDGAYHAGVLRALSEAGVRLDLVAGRGVGTVGALFSAIDGGARLWEPGGLWRQPLRRVLYPWRPAYRALALGLAACALLLVVPAALFGAGLLVYEIALLADAIGPGTSASVAAWWSGLVSWAFAPGALPTRLPQLVTAILAALILGLLVAAWRARRALPARRAQLGGLWWTLLGAPLAGDATAAFFIRGLWDLLRGGASVGQPGRTDLSRRYAELLADNLGQPGFRELILVAHDLDARHDVVFALLSPEARRTFLHRRPGAAADRRSSEAVDLAGASRDVLLDAVAGALAIPWATDAPFIPFAPESYWRGETHRLSDRPAGLIRLLEEAALAGARQVVLVTAAEELGQPHALSTRRTHPRARLGEYLASAEAASLRDALAVSAAWFDAVFVVRPGHNPLAPLDAGGAYDLRSDRWQTVGELVDRGYEDAYRQFVDPVVGASGEHLTERTTTEPGM